MNKTLLLKNQLSLFANWLLNNGLTPLPTKGRFEALRFNADTKQMPIVYNGKSKDYLSCNAESEVFVKRFINSIKGK